MVVSGFIGSSKGAMGHMEALSGMNREIRQ